MNCMTKLAGSAAILLCAGCASVASVDVAQFAAPAPVETHDRPPEGADPRACYGRDATPAEIETVTEQIQVQPASVSVDGKTLYPAVYKTETRQEIVKQRQERWFETPCSAELTPDFIASLQRALWVRGIYGGPVNGEMTPHTRAAIRTFQKQQGLDSSVLSRAAARQLGLVAFGEVPPGAGAKAATGIN